MTRREAGVWVAVLAAITIARIALVESLPDQGYFAKYLIFADRILAGDIPRDRLLDLSPMYLWFITALRALGADFTVIRGLQIVFVSIAALCAAIAARQWGRIASIAAAAFVLASRGALVCATELEPETLILMFNAAALATVILSRGDGEGSQDSIGRDPSASPRLRMTWAAGLLLGLSAICRPSALLAALLIAIVIRSWRVLAGAAIPVLIILAVNYGLTREIAVMDPGTVFYEGMNPSATGLAGVQPRIINDLERQSREPDFLHVAYRLVASKAAGRALTRAEANRYWTSKALAFMREYPEAAARLAGRKLLFALHSYEPYDLATMARKDQLLSRLPIFLPFGLLAGFAVVARRRGVPLAFAFAVLITLVVFYVTARQRNAMIPAMAVLAAAGLADVLSNRKLLPAVVVSAIAITLSLNGRAQWEDQLGWTGLKTPFDQALALQRDGKWLESDMLLQQIEDYRPTRENRAVPSIAYYRAVAAAHLGRDPRPLLDRAAFEAPGNEHVLAFRATLGDRRAARLLADLHDPFTARAALSSARH